MINRRWLTLPVAAILASLLVGCGGETDRSPVFPQAQAHAERYDDPKCVDSPFAYFEKDFVKIHAGRFMMGAPADEPGSEIEEWPQHAITLSRDFYMQTTEVTNEQFRKLAQWAYDRGYVTASSSSLQDNMGSNAELLDINGPGCEISFDGEVFLVDAGKENHPVKDVTWYGAASYCDWLSMRMMLPLAYDHQNWQCGPSGDPYAAIGYRLLTEAEWEYACRAGTKTAFANGPITDVGCNDPLMDQIGWYCGTAGGWTHPVAQMMPNAWGIHDMHGNLWEFVNDWWDADYYSSSPRVDPAGPASGSYRVIRGGYWGDPARIVRSAYRTFHSPGHNFFTRGFRPARSAE